MSGGNDGHTVLNAPANVREVWYDFNGHGNRILLLASSVRTEVPELVMAQSKTEDRR